MIYDQEEKLSNEELLSRIEGKVFNDDWSLKPNAISTHSHRISI